MLATLSTYLDIWTNRDLMSYVWFSWIYLSTCKVADSRMIVEILNDVSLYIAELTQFATDIICFFRHACFALSCLYYEALSKQGRSLPNH
jgi:hypothetical protein